MPDVLVPLLFLFHAGAVAITGRAWIAVGRGRADYRALRDVTGILDRAELVRRFGQPDGTGRFAANAAAVAENRGLAGWVLGDLPTHALFLLASAILTLGGAGSTVGSALIFGALLHAGVVVATALLLVLAAPSAVPFRRDGG